jgi:hypothetical protein
MQKRVVIIGGGFCGSLVARLLDRSEHLQVCLVDAKPFFEFTAAIVRMIPDPTADTIAVPHSAYIRYGQFVLGFVDAVYPDHVLLQAAGDTAGKRIPFDYCVLGTGSAYASSIKVCVIYPAITVSIIPFVYYFFPGILNVNHEILGGKYVQLLSSQKIGLRSRQVSEIKCCDGDWRWLSRSRACS